MTYQEQLARLQQETLPVAYVSNADYRRQKTQLTRAINSGDPRRVLRTVERTINEWSGKAWPDDWSRWRIALEDASWKARHAGHDELARELAAAAEVLFRL